MVSAEPSAECPASASANSAQPRGFLFWNCTRAGPTAYQRATCSDPSFSNATAIASHSARNAAWRSGAAP